MLKNIITHRPSLKLQFKINKNLIQSFKVLQMSLLEMHEFANKEIEINSANFTIAEVPAPGTFALSLLALGGMFFARKRVKS